MLDVLELYIDNIWLQLLGKGPNAPIHLLGTKDARHAKEYRVFPVLYNFHMSH